MNAFIIERLANELGEKGKANSIIGKELYELFTTSQFDINLVFEPLALKISFFQGQAYFQSPQSDKLQKKNRLPVFKSLTGCRVREIIKYPFDRRFDIVFDDGQILVFYLYGKFSQITHYVNEEWQESFPVKSSCIERYEQKFYSLKERNLQDLKFLLPEEKESLAVLDFDNLSDDKKHRALIELKEGKFHKRLYLDKSSKKYTLDYSEKSEPIAHFDNVIDALDNHSRLYISHQVFHQTKAAHLGKLRKELNAISKKLKSAEKGIVELNRARGYKEKADLIMANMWQIEKGKKEMKLATFDGLGEVKIKLQEMLTPQANAERYYTKSKNESKQRVFTLKHLAKVKQNYLSKQEEIESFEKINNLKEIRKKAVYKSKQKEVRLPYRSIEVDGFEIRIGRGAKDNDELLRFHTSKTDLWLHAKDVSGSHVIIRNPADKLIPIGTIEKVASIAAFYSKAKSESLAAVIYTQRKYIRKPKGATPGLVKVDREEVVLVEPMSDV